MADELYQGSQPAGSWADLYNDSIPQSYHPVVLVANYEFIPYNLTDYPVILVTNTGTEEAIRIEQDGLLASDRAALYVTSDIAQTTGIAMAYVYVNNTDSTIPTLKLENLGSGAAINFVKNITATANNEGDLVYDGTHLWFKGSGVAKDLIAIAGGGVTQVSAGAGMDFAVITATGTVAMGTPSDISATSANYAGSTTHTHHLDNTVVKTNGSYTDPSWIVHLPESKVLAAQTGHNGQFYKSDGSAGDWADAVTSIAAGDGMTFTTISTTGTVTMGTPGSITSSSTNAVGTGTHTHAVDSTIIVSTGSYSDPSWITSLAESKTLPAQAGKVGYYLQSNGTSTSWQQIPSDSDTLATVTGRGATTATHTYFTGNMTVGEVAVNSGAIDFAGLTSGTVTVKVADIAGTWTLTLPANDGSSGQFLQTDGNGVTSWATAITSPGGNDTYVQYNDGGAFGGDATFYFNDTSKVLTASYVGTQGVQFNTNPTITPTLGQLYWDTTDGTLAINIDIVNGVTLSLGHEMYLKAVNKTGSQIADGKAVYLYPGAQGNRPKIALAQADDYATALMVGVATQNIADDNEGVVTTYGVVHGFNTSGFTAGDTLYLDPDNAGGIINTIPTTPDYVVIIGKALNSTNNGSILVNPRMPLATDASMAADTSLVAPTQKAVKSALAGKQAASDNLTSLSGLTYASTCFVKMTGANTFTLDTNTYLTAESDTLSTVTGRGATTATAVTFEGNATLGKLSGTTGQLTFLGTTSGSVVLKVADVAGTWTMTLPANDGDNGQFLQTDGSGNTSWATVSSVPTVITVADEASDTTCFPAFFTDATGNLAPKTNANLKFNASTGLLTSLLASPSSITLGQASGTTGSVVFNGTTSGAVTFKVADVAGTWTMTLPATAGSSGQVMQSNGSGTMSWLTPGTVTAVSVATANGVSGTSSGGATPALTISLGAITPTTVNSIIVSGDNTSFNTYVGYEAGTHLGANGTYNVMLGWNAGHGASSPSLFRFNVGIGYAALQYSGSITESVAVGMYCMQAATSGSYDTCVGSRAGTSLSTGSYNSLIGGLAGTTLSGGSNNTYVGYKAGNNGANCNNNTGLGYQALYSNTTGSTSTFNNTAIGINALYTGATGFYRNIGLGAYAGYYATGHDELYIDNQDRSNNATEKTSSIIYGVMSNTASSQTLTFNAITYHTYTSAPTSSDGAALGTTALMWSDLFLAAGGVINFNNGNVTLTHSAGLLTSNAAFTATTITATLGFVPDANDGAYLGTTALQFSDLFLAEGGVINWDNGDATLTQAGNFLTLGGASFEVDSGEAFYLGANGTDGTWKFVRSGNDLIIQRRESGSYVTKSTISA